MKAQLGEGNGMTRTKRSWLAAVSAVVAGAFAIGVPLTSEAAPAVPIVGDKPIQPGAPLLDNVGINSPAFAQVGLNSPAALSMYATYVLRAWGVPYQGYCTLNFVFKDKAKKNASQYIGASSNCFGWGGVGQRAKAPGIGEFGTVVFNDVHTQFVLIRIDTAKLKYVSRVMRGYGAAPRGYTTSAKAKPGDLVITHGYPAGGTGPSGVTRVGVLEDSGHDGYYAVTTPILDRGSPVVRVSDGKAVGVSTELFWPLGQRTIEGILSSLRRAGFDVTL